MAFLALRVPSDVARTLAQIDIPGTPQAPNESHITIAYLGKNLPIEQVAEYLAPVLSVVNATRPFAVSTSRITTFPPNKDDGVPIIAPIDSIEIHSFHANLRKALSSAVPDFPPMKYDSYRPHVTLGYSQDPLVHADSVVDKTIPTLQWGVHELILWGGDAIDDRMIVTFPFSITGKVASEKLSLERAMIQLALRYPHR